MMTQQSLGLPYALIVVILCHLLLFTTADAQERRWMRVSPLQTYFKDYGNESEISPYHQAFLSWPAQYGDNQYTTWAKGLWIGAQNYYDPVEKTIKSVKVIGSGPRYDTTFHEVIDEFIEIFPQNIKLIGRSVPPDVIVDGQPGSVNRLYDVLDEVDPNLPCDRMIVITFNTSMGVSGTKKVFAFTQQNNNNYFIHDYVFKNTGIYNAAGDTLQQTLHQFWIHFLYHYAFAGVTCTGIGSTWGAFPSIWGGYSTNVHDFGNSYRAHPDSLRGFYAFYSPNWMRDFNSGITYEQDWGCPNQLGGGFNFDGLLGSAKYAGTVILCASKSPQDWSDDYSQPRTTTYFGGEDPAAFWAIKNQDNDNFMQLRYTKMSEGHLPQSMAESVGEEYIGLGWWYPQMQGNSDAGPTQGQGFGPYTLAPGDSIHIVFAEGVNGISWEKCREVGANWYAYYSGTGTPMLIKPDGSTTTSYTDYTKAWVQSGIDSIIQTYKNARSNYRSGYNIPKPPPAPNQFTVESGGDGIHLFWDNNAAVSSHFDGYVIYRSEGKVKDYMTVYEKIFECNASNVVHQWYDTTAQSGMNYYYYIQSKDDGTQNDLYPGTPLYSSVFLTMTTTPASLITGVAENTADIPTEFSLKQNYPNPFNPTTVISYRLPAFSSVKLTVYNVLGHRIKTLVNSFQNAGEHSLVWDATDERNNPISSGIYFYKFETNDHILQKKMILLR